MATKSCNFTDLTESIGHPQVDRENGIIRNVKILGRVSGNGREYSDRALQQAATLYESKGVNVNHPDRSTPNIGRSVQDGLGQLKGVNVKPDGVYGDLHYLKSHPVAEMLCEAAERMPERFGLSHNALGDSVERGGKRIVESIEKVRSVDLVQNPATVKSLFESEDPVKKQTTLLEILEAVPDKSRRTKAVKLLEMDSLSGLGATPVDMSGPHMMGPMTTDTTDTSGTSSDDQIRAAFTAAVTAVMADTTLSVADMLVKIENLLNAQAAALGIDIEAGEDPADGDPTVTESLQEQVNELIAERDALKAETAHRTLLESKGITVTPARLATLAAVKDGTVRGSLLEDWSKLSAPVKPGVQRPAKSPPANFVESLDTGYKPPTTTAEIIAAYRR